MTTPPRRISVAMAAYRGERFLSEQLESIAAQTQLPDELVVTDDSPDHLTAAIVEKFSQSVPFQVRIIKNETTLGYKANFFKAISHCIGDLIVLCDQDDVWLRQKIEHVVREFTEDDIFLVIHNVTLVDENLREVQDANKNHWHLRGCYPPLTVDPWYLAHGMSMTIRRGLVDWLGYPNLDPLPGFGHDTWFWTAANSLGKIVGLGEELLLYRQHQSNVCGAPDPISMKSYLSKSGSAGVDHYVKTALTALQIAEYLNNVNPLMPERIKARAREAVDFYQTLAKYYQGRAALYSETPRHERFRTMSRLLALGAYRPVSRQGLGRKAFVKDMFLSVLKHQTIA